MKLKKQSIMKTTTRVLGLSALVACTAFFTTSCKKTDAESALSIVTTDETSAAALAADADLPLGAPHHKMILPLLGDCGLPQNDSCMSFTVSGDSYPRTYVFTPIKNGTPHQDEKVSESITLIVSNDMHQLGSKQTLVITRSGDKGIMTMSSVIETIGSNDNGTLTFSLSETMNATGKRGDISSEMTGTITLSAGLETTDCSDDTFVINSVGKMTGKHLLKTFSSNQVTADLTISGSCDFPMAGTIITSGDKGDFSIDFGDGTCDNIAIVTKDGESITIDLSQKKGPQRGPGK